MTSIPPTDPAYPVHKQLEAYNARDIDAFMPWWADNCEYYAFPSTLLASNAAAIRERHITRFKEPDLCGTLLSRIVVGNVVVDHETVQRNFPEGRGEVDVICTYEVEHGKIAKAWFKTGQQHLHPACGPNRDRGSVAPVAAGGTTMHDHNADLLRPATKADLSSILDLTRRAYAKWVPLIGREPLPMTADYALALRTHRFDLLERAGRLIALVETILHPDHLWIENLAVSPEHRGQGLGHRMLAQAERLGAELGHTEIKLVTNQAFTGNVDFYRRSGFAIERREAFRGGVAVYCRKALLSTGPRP